MRKSFRVATIFTGAAACAVALAPAANAEALAPGGATKVTPELKGNCSAGTFRNSVHLYYEKSEKHKLAACYNVEGSLIPVKANKWASYCGGAYSGYFYIGGIARKFTAGTAYHPLGKQVISDVFISKFVAKDANDLCSPSRS
jgi:hypothetical protein